MEMTEPFSPFRLPTAHYQQFLEYFLLISTAEIMAGKNLYWNSFPQRRIEAISYNLFVLDFSFPYTWAAEDAELSKSFNLSTCTRGYHLLLCVGISTISQALI
jgi:hypothetical protein